MRFYFYAQVLRLGYVPSRLLRKPSDLFLFHCEPERIDHGHPKDGNFEDDRQLEIASGRQNRKYLCSQKYGRYHQDSNGKPKVLDHG